MTEKLSAEALTSPTTLTTALGSYRAPVLLAAAVLAGLQAGTYYTWASGVMPGLRRVDDRTFVEAIKQMNIAIVNPVFMLSFLGAPLLAGAAIAVTRESARPWAIAAAVLAVGTVVITSAGNVPLNDALDAAGPVHQIRDLHAVRAHFENRWVALNIARCLTSAGALACLAWAAIRS